MDMRCSFSTVAIRLQATRRASCVRERDLLDGQSPCSCQRIHVARTSLLDCKKMSVIRSVQASLVFGSTLSQPTKLSKLRMYVFMSGLYVCLYVDMYVLQEDVDKRV